MASYSEKQRKKKKNSKLTDVHSDPEMMQNQSYWRRHVFKVFNLMLGYNQVTSTLYSLLLLIELLEMLSFLFIDITISYPVQVKEFVYIYVQLFRPQFYLDYLGVEHIFEIQNDNMIFVPVSIVASLLLIEYICILIVIRFSKDGYHALFTNSILKSIIQFVGIYSVLLLKVFMIPFLMLMLSTLVCKREKLKDGSHLAINQHYRYQCWTPTHIVMSVIAGLFSAILIGHMLLQALIYHHQRVKSRLPWAGVISKAELFKTLIKIAIVLSFVLKPYSMWMTIIAQVANAVLLILLGHQRYYKFFHTTKKVFLSTVVQEVSYIWLTICMTILGIIDNELNISTFIYICTSLIFVNVLMVIFFLKKDSTISLTEFPNLTKETDYIWFFLKLKQVFSQNEEKIIERTVLLGLLKYHIPTCHNEECTCMILYKTLFATNQGNNFEIKADLFQLTSRETNIDSEQDLDDLQDNQNGKRNMFSVNEKRVAFQKDLFKFFLCMLSDVCLKHPKCRGLEFIQVSTLQEKLNNTYKAYFQILRMKKQKPPVEWDYFLYQNKKQLETIMYRKYQINLKDRQQSIDIIKVNLFENQFTYFEEQIRSTADNCLGFWKELLDKKLDVNRIHDFGVQISNSYTEVSGITKDMLSMYPDNLLLLKIYSFFLSNVMNNDFEANEYKMRAKSVVQNLNNLQRTSHDEDKYLGYNSPTAIITMTVTTKDIGNITHANFETKSLLGYQNKELKGKNVRILMPKLLGDNHDQFIKTYFETAKAHILEKQRLVFAKTKDGYIKPVCILVKAIPKLTHSLTFVGFLRKIEQSHPFLQIPSQFTGQDYHIVLANSEGQIYGFSQNCWETFGFKPSFFFNKFGDPDQNLRIDNIIRNLRSQEFKNKLMSTKDGCFCSLDTGEVVDNISKELLSRSEQNVLQNISGSYNINLQLQETSFSNGKIQMYVYKIIKMSRVIRSQNVLDMIYVKMYEQGEGSSNLDEESILDSNMDLTKQIRSIDSIENDPELVGQVTQRMNLANVGSMDFGDIIDQQNENKHIQDFKKSITNQEIPPQLAKLNRLVYALILVIIVICTFDFCSSVQFNRFSRQLITSLEDLYKKQILISQIGTNLVTFALVKQGLQSNYYQGYTNRTNSLFTFLQSDIVELKEQEQKIQQAVLSSGVYKLKGYDPNTLIDLYVIDQYGNITNQKQKMFFTIQQYLSGMQNYLYVPEASQYQLVPQLYRLDNSSFMYGKGLTELTQIQQSVYFIIQNSLVNINVANADQIDTFTEAFLKMIRQQSWMVDVIFAILCSIIILSGIIIFPIVVGVQKNKVMILSIYFELNNEEIRCVFLKCLAFINSIEARFDNQGDEAASSNNGGDDNSHMRTLQNRATNNSIQNQQIKLNVNNAPISHQQVDVLVDDSLVYEQDISDVNDSMQRLSERNSNRQFLSGRGDLHEDSTQKIDEELSRKRKRKSIMESLQEREDESKSQSEDYSEASQDRQEKSENAIKNNKKIDQENVFKQIKLRNNKINLVTMGGLLVFLSYFVLTFAVNMFHIGKLKQLLSFKETLFSTRITLQNSHFTFISNVMRNEDIRDPSDPDKFMFSDSMDELYKLQKQTQDLAIEIKEVTFLQGSAADFIVQGNTDQFCDAISSMIPLKYDQQQCKLIDNQELLSGLRQSIFKFLYERQSLKILFDGNRKNTTALKKLLNDPALLSYSVKSNHFYRAYFDKMLEVVQESASNHYAGVILFQNLKFIFFILGSLFILIILWRIFLLNIWDEVKRSKGMLNMIPIDFLQRDNNISKLSINKLSKNG